MSGFPLIIISSIKTVVWVVVFHARSKQQRFIQSPTPPPKKKSKVIESTATPNPGGTTTQTNPKIFAMFQRCIKWQNSWRCVRKWVNINFPLRLLYVNFKIFSRISNLNWFFAQTHKILPLGFLISFGIIINFQHSKTFALIFIKISLFKSKFRKNSWKLEKFFRFPLFLTNVFNIFASFGGSAPGPTPYKSIFRNFSKFFPNFRNKLDKILKKFQKIAKFL